MILTKPLNTEAVTSNGSTLETGLQASNHLSGKTQLREVEDCELRERIKTQNTSKEMIKRSSR